jgi:hypothetical protein
MTLQPFTSNFEDNSTEAGFQFTFFCDQCREGYKTSFVEASTYKKGRFLKGLGGFVGAASSMTGGALGNLAHGIQQGSNVISERFQGMSPQWHEEHEKAFQAAQNEAKGHFHRCPKCKKYVCENDWNEEPSLCVDCAPRESVEVASARAEKMVQDIKEKASTTQVFKGEINARQALCPQCGKPATEGKFCNNCGAALGKRKCARCGAENSSGAFCSECGNKL